MNINPLDFNYIDGLNTYPIQDYIDASITSNITSNIITCNINIGGNQTLNNSLYYLNSNLYLNNNAPFGNIYFKTSYNYPNSNNIGVKIDFSGKLQVYHNYNILQPTLGEGYYDVESEILQLKADGINTDVQLTALEAGAIYLQTEIDDLLVAINLLEAQLNSLIQNIYFSDTYNQLRNVTLLTDYSQYAAQYATLTNNIATQANAAYVNSFAIGAATSVGFGIAGAALSATASYFYYQRASNAVFSNVNFSNAQKTIVYNNNSNKEITTYNNYYTSSCNLSINQGFINSNITTQQLIPKLKSNEITLNNKAITKFSLDNLDDWIKTTNGIYYDITNGTLAINSTPTTVDFFRVGGQVTIQGDIICETKLKVDNANLAIPAVGINGGNGDKLILRAGTASIHPYSLGINTNNLWYSVPSGASHSFYVNGSPITTISSTGLSTTGIINATTNLQENSVNLTSKYLQLSGGTMSGNLGIGTSSTIVFTDRILNDLITLYTGYGFGINASTLRYNAPIAASHIFYVNNAAITTISSTGLSTTGYFKATTGIITGDATYQLMINPPSSTSASTLQTIQQGVGYNQILALQVSGGNVGIGTNSTSAKLEVNGNVNISVANPVLTINSTVETQKAIIFLSTPFNSTSALKTAIISEGYSGWGRSKLHFCLNNSGNPPGTGTDYNTAPTYNATINDARMTILPNGNVGINTTSPNCLLSVNKVDYKILSFFDNGLTNSYQYVGLGANSGLCFNNFATGDAFQFRVGTSATTANELMRINGNGSVCIGTTAATSVNTKLTISGASYGYSQPLVQITQNAAWDGNHALQVSGYTNLGGIRINGGDVGNTIYQSTLNANMGFTMNPGNTTGGNMLFYTQGAAGNIIFNTSGANERLRITPSGNVGIGTITARSRLDVYNGDIIIRSINEGTNATLFFGTPNTTSTDALKCALICQGMSTWSRSKLHICLNNTVDNNAFYNAAIADACASFDYNGNVGIGNTIPLDDGGNNTFLCLGTSSINGSCGNLVIAARNSAGTGHRHFRATIDTNNWTLSIGDFGSGNTIGTFVQQFIMSYLAPTSSLLISASGQVIMPFGYTTSDERIKTDITTIDNALWKVSQLRGVEYTHIQENIRSIGVIAQEVENIIPEAVYTDIERDNLKSVNYSGLVGLLINAIKEQQDEINNLKYILRKNNIQ